ncbi:unnamed protein product [Toxocara canis]|uniref:Uncharacterized protein n=1 Tax=Toxocara canis TaxID=6265 RepID=A0A183UD73_TOXCA|nr:unnamed protein product [Toxocara canis]
MSIWVHKELWYAYGSGHISLTYHPSSPHREPPIHVVILSLLGTSTRATVPHHNRLRCIPHFTKSMAALCWIGISHISVVKGLRAAGGGGYIAVLNRAVKELDVDGANTTVSIAHYPPLLFKDNHTDGPREMCPLLLLATSKLSANWSQYIVLCRTHVMHRTAAYGANRMLHEDATPRFSVICLVSER